MASSRWSGMNALSPWACDHEVVIDRLRGVVSWRFRHKALFEMADIEPSVREIANNMVVGHGCFARKLIAQGGPVECLEEPLAADSDAFEGRMVAQRACVEIGRAHV